VARLGACLPSDDAQRTPASGWTRKVLRAELHYLFFLMASEAICTALVTTSVQASGPPDEAYSSASVLLAKS
jgi:hypothetical protein